MARAQKAAVPPPAWPQRVVVPEVQPRSDPKVRRWSLLIYAVAFDDANWCPVTQRRAVFLFERRGLRLTELWKQCGRWSHSKRDVDVDG